MADNELSNTLLTPPPYGRASRTTHEVPRQLACMCRVVVGVLLCVSIIIMSTVYVYVSTSVSVQQAEDVVKTMIAVNDAASPCRDPQEYFCTSDYPTPYKLFDLRRQRTCPYIRHAVIGRINRVLNRYACKLGVPSCATTTPVSVVGNTSVIVNPHFVDTILQGAHELSVLAYVVYPVLIAKGIEPDKAFRAVVSDASYSSLPLGRLYSRYKFMHTATAFYNCYTQTLKAKKLCVHLPHLLTSE